MKTKILWFLLILTSLFCVMACGSVKSYSVTYQNVSVQDVYNLQGLWGEKCTFFLPIGRIRGMEENAIFPSGKTRGDVICDIPDRVGGRWISENGEDVEYWVSIDKLLLPKVGNSEWYEFIVSVRQSDIRQVEVVIHDRKVIHQKKKKAMLYCTPSEECLFVSPYTSDTPYDCENLTSGQLKKLREESAKKRVIMEGFKEGLRADLKERGINLEEREYIDNSCPENP